MRNVSKNKVFKWAKSFDVINNHSADKRNQVQKKFVV